MLACEPRMTSQKKKEREGECMVDGDAIASFRVSLVVVLMP